MAKHTHGPLTLRGFSIQKDWADQSVQVASLNESLDWHENLGKSREEAEANGRLFAAAPDLLAALREARTRLREVGSETGVMSPATIAMVNAAIARAEGM